MTIKAGGLVDSADFIGIANPPQCKISANAAQSIANTTLTTVTFAVTDYDSNNMADLANNRIVIKTAGWYTLTAFVAWANNATGYRLHIADAGPSASQLHIVQAYLPPASGTSTGIFLTSHPFLCAVNDIVDLHIQQSSGAALNISSINSIFPFLAVSWYAKP